MLMSARLKVTQNLILTFIRLTYILSHAIISGMEIDASVFSALDAMGVDSSHLMEESYVTADWSNLDAVKQAFPKLGEGMILTNGEDIYKVEGQVRGDHAFVPNDISYIQGVMRLKTLHPDLPVYELHNHPTVEAAEAQGVFFGDGPGDTSAEAEASRNRQRLASSVPSAADIRSWDTFYNLVCAGIYSQDIDEVRLWRNGDARHKIGSKLALERDEHRDIVNAYWAPQDDNVPNTEYIQPKDWSEANMTDLLEHFTRNTFAYKG